MDLCAHNWTYITDLKYIPWFYKKKRLCYQSKFLNIRNNQFFSFFGLRCMNLDIHSFFIWPRPTFLFKHLCLRKKHVSGTARNINPQIKLFTIVCFLFYNMTIHLCTSHYNVTEEREKVKNIASQSNVQVCTDISYIVNSCILSGTVN